MPIERGDVPGLAPPPGYTHWAAVSGGRLVFLAGQVPLDERGELVGEGDVLAQTRQVVANLALALRAVGATPRDAVRTTIYVVAGEQRQLGEVWRAVLDSEIGDVCRTAATLVGAARLGYAGQLVEIEVTLALGAG